MKKPMTRFDYCQPLTGAASRTVYQLKHGLLDDYLIRPLKNPTLKMELA